MNIKSKVAGLVMLTAATCSFAANQNVAVQGNVAYFNNAGSAIGADGDYVFFTGLPIGTYNYSLTLSAQSIDFTTANFEGKSGTKITTGTFTFLGVTGNGVPEPNFVLYLRGTATGPSPVYSGTLVVTPAGG